jgi:hypothetical protein
MIILFVYSEPRSKFTQLYNRRHKLNDDNASDFTGKWWILTSSSEIRCK